MPHETPGLSKNQRLPTAGRPIASARHDGRSVIRDSCWFEVHPASRVDDTHHCDGSRNAMYSPTKPAPPMASTRYCLPSNMYVIGDPDCGAGMYTAPTSVPVPLS